MLHRHEFVSLRSCRPPFPLPFLSLFRWREFSLTQSHLFFSGFVLRRHRRSHRPRGHRRSRIRLARKASATKYGTQPSSKNTSRSADPKSESTPRISRAILSDQRAIGLTIFLFVALAAQVIFKATVGNGDSNTLGLFSRVTYLFMRVSWPQAYLE